VVDGFFRLQLDGFPVIFQGLGVISLLGQIVSDLLFDDGDVRRDMVRVDEEAVCLRIFAEPTEKLAVEYKRFDVVGIARDKFVVTIGDRHDPSLEFLLLKLARGHLRKHFFLVLRNVHQLVFDDGGRRRREGSAGSGGFFVRRRGIARVGGEGAKRQ